MFMDICKVVCNANEYAPCIYHIFIYIMDVAVLHIHGIEIYPDKLNIDVGITSKL